MPYDPTARNPVSVTPFEVIAGPADVWVAIIGTAFPAIATTSPAVAWNPLGYTDGGITVQHQQTIQELEVDQSVFPAKAIRSRMTNMISFSIAELTLENYKYALNYKPDDAPGAAGAQDRTLTMDPGATIKTMAMLIRGPSPYGDGSSSVTNWFLQYEMTAVYQSGNPQVVYTRENKAVLALEFKMLATSGSTLRARDAT